MQNSSRRLSALWFLTALVGCAMVLTALLAIISAFVLPDTVLGSYAPVLVGVSLIAVMLGFGLLVTGIRGWRMKQSRLITTRWGWLILFLAMLVLGGFALMVPTEFQSDPIFAPFHFGMVVLPAFIGLLLVIRLSGPNFTPTFRQVILTITGGASSVLLALPLEIVGFILVAVVLLIGASLLPAGQAEVSRLISIIQLWAETPPTDMETLLSVATSPIAVIGIILILSVLTPLIEEFVKTLVMGVMGFWVRPGLGTAFIWGLSCGLGFALVEGITNGSVGLGNAGWWLGGIFARVMASMMHALTSGLLGLGWGFLWENKWWCLPLFYAIAVAFHGLWNFSVILLAIGGIMSSAQLLPGLVLALMGGGILLICVSLVTVALIAAPIALKYRGDAKGSLKHTPAQDASGI